MTVQSPVIVVVPVICTSFPVAFARFVVVALAIFALFAPIRFVLSCLFGEVCGNCGELNKLNLDRGEVVDANV